MDKLKAEKALCVKGVIKTFGEKPNEVHALKGVDLMAHSGELLMIVGPSGCGKTTLLSITAGTLKANEGEVDLFSTSLNKLSQKETTEFRKNNIGFIFQQYHLIPTLNCLENISVPLLLNGASKKRAEEQSAAMLERVGLKGREKDSPKNLSGGQQQRIAIARALVHEPRLLICDEPTAALDAETGAKVIELVIQVARTPGRCVLLVTHDSRIFKYADRIAKMDDGRIVDITHPSPSTTPVHTV